MKERALLRYVRKGLNNAAIARALGLRPQTARNLLTGVLQKLGVASRGRLIASLHGLLTPAEQSKFPPNPNPCKRSMYPASYSPNRSVANSKIKREKPAENPWPLLSAAEHRVALQLMHGLSNKEIARAIGRSNATVKNQMRSMFCRAGYNNRGTLTVALLKNIDSAGGDACPPGETNNEAARGDACHPAESLRLDACVRGSTSDGDSGRDACPPV